MLPLTASFAACECLTALPSIARPALVRTMCFTRASSLARRLVTSLRRSNGFRFAEIVVWSMARHSANPPKLSGEGRFNIISREYWKLFKPSGRNASSNIRPIARLARCTRRQRQLSRTIMVVSNGGAAVIEEAVNCIDWFILDENSFNLGSRHRRTNARLLAESSRLRADADRARAHATQRRLCDRLLGTWIRHRRADGDDPQDQSPRL
jgi:hypothetical protein